MKKFFLVVVEDVFDMKFEGKCFIKNTSIIFGSGHISDGNYNGQLNLNIVVEVRGPDEFGSSFNNIQNLKNKLCLKITLEEIGE